MQNPVSATVTEAAPVAMIPSAQSGSTKAASVVVAIKTSPAISQTVRSMYQRLVGTIYTPERRGMVTTSDVGIRWYDTRPPGPVKTARGW
jgi:hypothetical protein